jgi:hypothetical protein
MAKSLRHPTGDSQPVNQPDNGESDGDADFPYGANVNPAAEEAAPGGADRVQPAQPSADPDPFDPATYRVRQTLAEAAGVKKHMTELPVCTPNKAWWVRRHPDSEFSLTAWVIELKDEQETYLVLPPLWPALMGEATFKPKTFYLSVTRQGKLFLWPVRVPVDDTKEPDRWMRVPLEAVRLAREKWTRITWNEQTRQHDLATIEAEDEPEWPDLPMRELVKLAFKGCVIDSLEHPVLRRLRGESA